MGKDRFGFIKNMFHVQRFKETNIMDPLHELRYFLDYIIGRWQNVYYPKRDLCIDETIIPYNNRHHKFTVDLRNKPHSNGFLMYGIAEALTGYMLKGEIYTGREKGEKNKMVNNQEVKSSNTNFGRIVRLLENYMDKGHILFVDNFYTTMELANFLSLRKTGLVGTLRHNRAKEQGLDADMMRDEVRYFENTENQHILLTIWFDSIKVKTLSTCIKPTTVIYKKGRGTKSLRPSPLVFKEYNFKKGGVDLSNHFFAIFRNSIRFTNKETWWMYIFKYFFQVSINNAFLLFKQNIIKKLNGRKRQKGDVMPRKQFILFIARNLLDTDGGPNIADKDLYFQRYERKFGKNAERKHNIPHLAEFTEIRGLCYKCKRETKFSCKDCGDGVKKFYLCVPCFEDYHRELFKNKNQR